LEKPGEAGDFINRPCAVEAWSEKRKIALREQAHRNNPVVHHQELRLFNLSDGDNAGKPLSCQQFR
jgi:hypothetical protein